MAVQGFSTSNAFNPRIHAKGVEAEALAKAVVSPFIGKTSSSLIQLREELGKGPGDTLRVGLRMQMDESTRPKQGNAGLEGNERTLNFYTDDLKIDHVRDAVRWYDVIDAQRITFEMREEARAALADYFTAVFEQWFFNQVAGALYADDTDTSLTGNNAVVAAESIYRPGGITTDELLVSTTPFSVELLDVLIERAKTRSPLIRPASIEGLGDYYVCFLHPYQVTSLRAVDSFWTALNRDILRSGKFVESNPLFTGALGAYNGTLLVESKRVPLGVNSSTAASVANTRRAIFCGAQAASFGVGRLGGTPDRFRWVEESFDYKNEVGIACGMVGGLKKLVFNSTDFATIVVPTYAAAS
jgi:N4-gp56 family major capsid protein